MMTKRRISVAISIIIVLLITFVCIPRLFVFRPGDTFYAWFLVACVLIGGMTIISIVRAFTRRRAERKYLKREFRLKMIARFMILFFTTGTILFATTFSIINTFHNPECKEYIAFNDPEIIIRAIISSLDLFMLDIDTNVLDTLKGEPTIKALIVIQGAASFGCTIALLISLLYSRIKTFIRLNLKTVSNNRNHLYLLFGINSNSHLLATSIEKEDPKATVIFIDHSEVSEDNQNSWDNIVSLFVHRQQAFEMADESKSLITVATRRISDLQSDEFASGTIDILGLLGLERIRNLIDKLKRYPDDARLRIFFLSDDEDNNIRSLINIAKDTTVREWADFCLKRDKEEQKRKEKEELKNSGIESNIEVNGEKKDTYRKSSLTIYVHARYNGPNRIVEDLGIRKNLDVEIVDSSHLAVELMKADPECQPVNVVKTIKGTSLVEKPLESLIVGFGEVGRDAFRFIYEFGTFIGEDKTTGSLITLRPNIVAIDNRMDKIEGIFRSNIPGIRFSNTESDGTYSDDKKIVSGLRLENMDSGHINFFNKELTPERCRELNYIVIALGDDDTNIGLASAIFNRIRRYRKDMTDLQIMVRCVSEEKVEMTRKIAAHYNEVDEKMMTDEIDEQEKRPHLIIRLFGQPEKIYSYETIVRDNLTQRGKVFYKNYTRIIKDNEDWETRHLSLTGRLNKESDEEESEKLVIPNLNNLRKLRRKENQDFANALHASTKIYLLKQALSCRKLPLEFYNRILSGGESLITGNGATLHYPELNDQNKIMLHLAMLEHARWNAAHELLGYSVNPDKTGADESKWLHNCLVDWTQLDEVSIAATTDYKRFDFSVVETSIYLYFNDIKSLKISQTKTNDRKYHK